MPFVNRCVCGNPTDSFGGFCDRCVALHTLGLDMQASEGQIESAYQALVKACQPERFQNDPKTRASAEEKLKEIHSAHEFLTSRQPVRTQVGTTLQRPEPQEEWYDEELPPEEDSVSEPESGLETAEVRRILRRQRRGRMSLPRFLLQFGFTLGAIATLAILWFVVDAILMSNPKTAGPWDQYKAELARDLHSSGVRLLGNATDNLHKDNNGAPTGSPVEQSPVPSQQPGATPNPATASTTPEPSRSAAGPPHVKVGGPGKSPQPYVTSGLTPTEVLAILGPPTSSSGEKMFYKGSEIDFRDGRVVGWTIDPKTSPVRVKLWPSAPLAPGLTQFALGSSKSDVVAVQGTPTLFSDNKFGYGNSVVFFQNGRVVGWNEDPKSARLRVAH